MTDNQKHRLNPMRTKAKNQRKNLTMILKVKNRKIANKKNRNVPTA